jgi:hypothetical protein
MQSDHLLGDLGNQMYTTYPKIPEKRTGTPQLPVAPAHTQGNHFRVKLFPDKTPRKKRRETRLRMRAPKGTPSRSRVPTFCTITILRKKVRGKSAHAHTITPATAGQGRYW